MGEDQLDDLELDGPITLRILDGNSLGLHASEMMEVMEDREVWRLNLELLPPQPSRKAGNEERRRKRYLCSRFSLFTRCIYIAASIYYYH